MVTAGVVLAYTHHIAWLALPLFAGLNMHNSREGKKVPGGRQRRGLRS